MGTGGCTVWGGGCGTIPAPAPGIAVELTQAGLGTDSPAGLSWGTCPGLRVGYLPPLRKGFRSGLRFGGPEDADDPSPS